MRHDTDASGALRLRAGNRRNPQLIDLQLTGKTAFVSGSTAGIGFATAHRLAAEGAHVTVNGRTQSRVDAAVAKIQGDTGSASVAGVAADLGNADGAARVLAALPSVDILVNNLGIFEPKPFPAITDADWLRFFETNVMSGVRLARAYLPHMRAQNWGRIVFVSSESGVNIPPEMVHYGTTKTAQVAVARGLAESLAGTAVTVNSVLAGPTASEGVTAFVANLARERGVDAATMEKEFFATARPSSLLKRFIRPDEIASLIAYIASPLASATTGAALRVDGGVVRAAL
ncbi:MAG TPA: SDR family oxidoreductase [Rhodanobacteraceae bacterium]